MNQQLVFQDRFAELVRSGKKRQTIRPWSPFRDKLQVGDKVLLRSWTDKPYKSKQKRLGVGIVTDIFEIKWSFHRGFISAFDILVDMAKRDGFESVEGMVAWFEKNHPKPKRMVVIRWELEK